ncbi:MAG TPA: endo-1,4-beta-glucanase, partial [Micromonosporaceae bacterium]|nr:endo-1,4-beta-glucanase [Micromonosporaceae bacterium]
MRMRRLALGLVSVLVASVLVPATPAQAAGTCDDFGTVTQGKYWINNNVWGQDSGSGWQCIWDSYTSGNTIGWGTSYGWLGQSNSVKSYASSVLGWHWGWKVSNTGLPVRLSANRSVNTGWNFSVQHSGGSMNVAYDLWLHT